MTRRTVAVVFGGRSTEHGISCLTAGGVMGAIDRDAWNVIAVGIDRGGAWSVQSDEPADWIIRDRELPEVPGGGDAVLLPERAGDTMWRAIRGGHIEDLAHVDVVFPVLHGPWGEDGSIQGAFELTDVRFVGSGVLASALGMDKQHVKTSFIAAGLPVAPSVSLAADEPVTARRADVEALGLPVFVKPARAGSSMGVSRADSWDEVVDAVASAAEHDPKVLIEAAIVGREIECAVLQDGADVRVSPPGEVVTGGDHDFYDFDAKYVDEEAVDLICPAELPDDVAATVQDFARRAFAAIGGEGLARVDCFVRADGSVVVNEINTMPGFTATSMYPRMWASAGVDYTELVSTLLETAAARPLGLR